MKHDVFISYARPDQSFSQRLAELLSSQGFSVYYDIADIAVGNALVDSLQNAILNSRYVLIVMSPDYFNSLWSKKELELALNQEIETNTIKVIPLLYRDCEIPPLLNRKVYLDFRSSEQFKTSEQRLIESLGPKSPKKSFFKRLFTIEDSKESNVEIGSIPKKNLESDELKSMITDLKLKVESFIDDSQSQKTAPSTNSTSVNSKLCFVVMPFNSDDLNDIYEYFLKPAIENNCGLKCVRGDDVFGSNIIMEDIRKSIENARLIVADLTDRNSNVFYEVGIAHALNKDVLLLSQSLNDIPFDLRHRRVLIYNNTPKGCKKLELAIVENIVSMINN